jgi:hypothetical protein
LSMTTTEPATAKAWIEETFPNTRCLNNVGENLVFEIFKGAVRSGEQEAAANSDLGLPQLFELIEANKERLGIQDYSVA